jgi:hypothetical protein
MNTMRQIRWFAITSCAFFVSLFAHAQTVAITVDDLPYAGSTDQALTVSDLAFAREANRKL